MQLIEKSINPSFYSTFPFVYTAWKHYRSENDQLFILVVRRDATLVGIAPFRIESVKVGNIRLLRGMRLRVIRFIAEWGSGDKPVNCDDGRTRTYVGQYFSVSEQRVYPMGWDMARRTTCEQSCS